jgi:type IV secretory pathway VirB2 component (pilin)
MKERIITKGGISSLLGLGCIIFCGVMLYTGKATNLELTGFFTLGLTLIRAKDSLIGLGEEK